MAAHLHNCAAVIAHDRTISELDPELHATVFVRNYEIKRCLDSHKRSS